MPRWAPLTQYLQDAEQDRLDLRLTEIEDILGAPLPASARRHRTIVWSNSRSNPYARIWRKAGYRSSLRGLSTEEVAFVRDGAPSEAGGRPDQRPLAESTVVLVGCVKTKADTRLPARDLYRSPLFLRRRRYAEGSGKPWFVLSALHGLVHPDEPIEPYDLYLATASEAYRHDWAKQVVEQIEQRFGDLTGQVFELHASAAYAHPVVPSLRRSGAQVIWPFEGLTFGEHLAWYRSHPPQAGAPEPPPEVTVAAGGDRRGTAARQGLARRISDDFWSGRFDLGARLDAPTPGWSGLPEVRAADALRHAGADDVAVRVFCTFLATLERGRDPEQLWQRGVELYRRAGWVFRPPHVIETSQTALSDVLHETGVSRRHLADAAAWRFIAEGLFDPAACPEIHSAVHGGRGDASALLDAVERLSGAGTPLFPSLREPDTATRWVRLLAYPGGARITSLDKLPLTIDARVRKVSEYLDVSRTDVLPLEEARTVLPRLWAEDIELHGAAGPPGLADSPAAVQPALWFMSTWGCSWCERVGQRQPISDVCGTCRFDAIRGAATDGDGRATSGRRREPGRTTARQQILAAARELTVRGSVPFSPAELIGEVQRRGTSYPPATLRTHIVSTMCVNAPGYGTSRYPDLLRVARGQYRLQAAER